jgi:hypothetical protein
MTLRAAVLSLLLTLPPACRAVAPASASSADFGPWLAGAAAAKPQGAYAEGWRLPLDFIEHLRKTGRTVDSSSVKDAAGKPLTYADVARLWKDFGQSRPAADAQAAAEKGQELPLRFTGVEIGKGPHSAADPLGETGDKTGLGLAARVRLDGLGVRAKYKHAESWPTLTAGALIHLDLLGSMNVQQAREAVYAASFQPVETPKGGFEVSAGATIDERWHFGASYGDKTTSFVPLETVRQQVGSLTVGMNPLGKNKGRDWNVGLNFSPEYQVATLAGVDKPASEKKGAGFSTGASFRYALKKLPLGFLRPPPEGNGVVWPEAAKTSVALAASEIQPMTMSWAAQVSLFVTKYVLLTPGVNTSVQPQTKSVGVTPLLGLGVVNPSDS